MHFASIFQNKYISKNEKIHLKCGSSVLFRELVQMQCTSIMIGCDFRAVCSLTVRLRPRCPVAQM